VLASAAFRVMPTSIIVAMMGINLVTPKGSPVRAFSPIP
jgi:hypothetical protein